MHHKWIHWMSESRNGEISLLGILAHVIMAHALCNNAKKYSVAWYGYVRFMPLSSLYCPLISKNS